MAQINTNLNALSAQRFNARSAQELGTSLERLSSGLRINSARDDAAGLAISERLGAAVTGLTRAGKNASDAISLLQVAESSVTGIIDNFQRIRELAVQSLNGSNSSSDRQALQAEANTLVLANFQFANQAQFNQQKLLDGTFSALFQVGANAQETLRVAIDAVFVQPSRVRRLADVPLHQVNLTGQVSSALGAGDLSINGTAVGASQAGAGAGQGNASAFAIAAAINSAAVPGVTASAANSLSGTATGAGNIANGALSVNGVALGPINGANAAALAASAAAAFATAAGASGVSASASGAGLTLRASDGRDIVISEAVAGQAALLGLTTGTHHGTITISNTEQATSSHLDIGGSHPAAAGLTGGSYNSSPTGRTEQVLVNVGVGGEPALDISTVTGANQALTYIDAKIDHSNTIRASLGALQNRFERIYTSLLDSAATQSAARARIRDADFASETAQLARRQILQQASSAILAQANSLPNQTLTLLR